VLEEDPILWCSTRLSGRPSDPIPAFNGHERDAMKKDIHPEYFPEAKVLYRGEEVMTVGATVPELKVEIWSGSHPFFTGKSSFVDTAGRVEKFQRKFQGNYFKKNEKTDK